MLLQLILKHIKMNIIGSNSEIIELNFLSQSYPDSVDENDKKWIDTEILIKLNVSP